jgi:hypothetical protein
MPWHINLLLGIPAAVIAGILVNLVWRAVASRRPRVTYIVSERAVFGGSAVTESIQTLTIENRGTASAMNVLLRLEGLPPSLQYKYVLHSKEVGHEDKQTETGLLVRQDRLLPGDRIEVSFKFTGGDYDLARATVDVRADHGIARGVAAESAGQHSASWLPVVGGLSSSLAVCAILVLWLSPQVRYDLLESPAALRKLETTGQYGRIHSLLQGCYRARVRLSCSFPDSSRTAGDTMRLEVRVDNLEHLRIDNVRLSFDDNGVGISAYGQPNPYGRRSFDLKSMQADSTSIYNYYVVASEGQPGDVHTVGATLFYDLYGEERMTRASAYFQSPAAPTPATTSHRTPVKQ